MADLPLQPNPSSGSSADFYSELNTVLDQMKTNDQDLEDRVEAIPTALFGSGVITGSFTPPVFAAGTGLTVNVAALSALIGIVVTVDAQAVVVQASETNYVFLLQDGTFQVNTTGTDPGTDSNPAILLGTATTSGSAVTGADFSTAPTVTPPGSNKAIKRVTATAGDGGTWDATNRSGGSHYVKTLSDHPDPSYPLMVLTERAVWVEGDDYTRSGTYNEVITYADGARLNAGETATYIYRPL